MDETMKDEELLMEFVRKRYDDEVIVFFVCRIVWDGQHTPVKEWVPVSVLPVMSSPAEIEKAKRALLKRRRFFKVCEMCGERKPDGWMHDNEVCQSCAERELGVVY
jgi:hypothetical protein